MVLHIRFEVLTAVDMKRSIFWNIMPCSPLKVNWHFGGTCRSLLHGRRISQARNQRESKWEAELCSAYSLTLKNGDMFLQNVR
jgi:hypothetical protein